ncbi:MAG: hypothetical protein ACR2OZ_06935 [Verrucomicrobiales bacterium]
MEAIELGYSVTDWLALSVRYASMWFEEENRQTLAFVPSIQLSPRVQLRGGVQFLRGGELENNLFFGGFSISF